MCCVIFFVLSRKLRSHILFISLFLTMLMSAMLAEVQLNRLEPLQNLFHTWVKTTFSLNSTSSLIVFPRIFASFYYFTLFIIFEFVRDTHILFLRSSESIQLMKPMHYTRFYGHSYTVQAIRQRKALQVRKRSAEILTSIKFSFKTLFIRLSMFLITFDISLLHN